MQHSVGNDINSDTECTEGLPDSEMEDKGSTDVPCEETWEMGSWNLPFQVTASVDISCQQRLQCVCAHFKDAVSCEHTFFPSSYFPSDTITSSLIPDDFVTASVSVSKMLSNAGTHTEDVPWVLRPSLLENNKKKLGARKHSRPLDIFNNKKSLLL